MPKLIDLTGKKFGKLTVLEKAEPHYTKSGVSKVFWKCVCDCGCVTDISAVSLSSGQTLSCGCANIEDLSGKRFDRLSVVTYVGDLKDNLWRCRCDCGNVVDIKGNILKRGLKKSCGCGLKTNLVGCKFGKLTVIEPAKTDGGFAWKCKCDCGNETFAKTFQLKNGLVSSCGCLRKLDLVGKKFGRLLVIKNLGITTGKENKNSYHRFECLCDCGNTCTVIGRLLVSGNTRSCGCLSDEAKHASKKHGFSYDRLYKIYAGMLQRCYNSNKTEYSYYGARGIVVCDEWKNDFMSFKEWAYDNGYDPNLHWSKCTIDRIDVNGNYCPENCRWVNMKHQGNNRRNNKYIEYNGEIHTLSEWADIVGISSDTLYSRIGTHGWTIEKALTTSLVHEGYNRKEVDAIE